eukprot:Hpha_TRINITY_DN16293_c0_g3::TRINITY_DN16293_c0_g3_i1::g.14352::m.14352
MHREDLRSTDAEGNIPEYEKMTWRERFMQMQTPSWQPEFSTPWVASALALTTVVFIPLGVLILIASDKAQSVRVRYDNPNAPCTYATRLQNTKNTGIANPTPDQILQYCDTTVSFDVPETMDPPVYMYYEITGFNQNFRRLVDSRSDEQLSGQTKTCACRDDLACPPQRYIGEFHGDGDLWVSLNQSTGATSWKQVKDIPYGPCGQMAYVMFNDTFTLKKGTQSICNTELFDAVGERVAGATATERENPCDKKDIAWSGDTRDGGRYSPMDINDETLTAQGLTTPARTVSQTNGGQSVAGAALMAEGINRGYYWREFGHNIPRIEDLDLIVWMRPATLPTFKKLHRILRVGLEKGTYTLVVRERYPVSQFDGEKAVVFATRTWVGADNAVLGVAYTIIGSLACAFAIAFLLGHMWYPQGGYTREQFDLLEQDAFTKGLRAF